MECQQNRGQHPALAGAAEPQAVRRRWVTLRIVLLPGLDGTGLLFRPLVANLSPSLRPVIVSYPPDRTSYSELLPVVRASLPAGEQFLIVAESYSGPLAILAAAERPEGLVGVVLAASFARSPVPGWLSPFRRLVGPWLLRWTPWSLVAGALLGRSSELSPLAADVRRVVSGIPVHILAARLREVFEVDVAQKIAQIGVPILYLAASRDLLVRGASVRLIQRHARNLRLIILDAPHLLLQVASAEAAHEISEFGAQAIAV